MSDKSSQPKVNKNTDQPSSKDKSIVEVRKSFGLSSFDRLKKLIDDEADQEAVDFQVLFDGLMETYQGETQSGKISPERKTLFDSVMRELEQIVKSDSENLLEKMVDASRLRNLLERINLSVVSPDAIKPSFSLRGQR